MLVIYSWEGIKNLQHNKSSSSRFISSFAAPKRSHYKVAPTDHFTIQSLICSKTSFSPFLCKTVAYFYISEAWQGTFHSWEAKTTHTTTSQILDLFQIQYSLDLNQQMTNTDPFKSETLSCW